MSKIRVLVVDDSQEMRDFVVQYVLEPNGFEILQANDGAEGLRVVLDEREEIDLILLDLEMPRMTGFDVLDRLRAQRSEIPVILMTSHGSEAIAVEVFHKGVRDYVIKPFTVEEMLEAIEQALTAVRLQREKEALTTRLVQAKRQLEQRLREFDTLYRVGKSVTSLTTLEQLLERVVEATLYVIGAEEGAILLVNDDGSLHEVVRKRRVTGRNQRVSRRSESQLAVDAMRKGKATGTSAMLYAPLKAHGQAIGVLGVSNKVTARSFSDHDRRLIMILCDYAAIAIENARLLQHSEQARDQEKRQILSLFERYVSPSVVEKLMAQPEGIKLGGVRQRVSILFADIRGFSNFSTRANPEVLVDVLNRHITVAAESILAEGGTLDKFLGDAVMAYFNAPLPQPDHALRAVRAGWRLCRAIEASQPRLPPASRLQFGIGISSGEALVGNIGAPQLMSFTVIGDAVNVSRRLQERAQGGQILICQQAYGLVKGYVEAEPMGVVEIKGHAQPEPVYEVLEVHV